MPSATITPASLATEARAIGRARVFQCPYWDGTTNLGSVLAHLGDTEGDIGVQTKDQIVKLTLPELTGDATIKAYLQGGDPEVTLPLFLATPALRPILSPSGVTGGAGYSKRREVKYRTLALIPEDVFLKADGTMGALAFNSVGSVWTVGGVAISAEQQRLLDLSIWIWKGYFMKPAIQFKHGDGGKIVDQATLAVCQDLTKPEGEQLYTRGDPSAVAINIAPV